MLALLHSTVDRWEHEKYLFLPLYKIWKIHLWQCTLPGLISQGEKAKWRWSGSYLQSWSWQHFTATDCARTAWRIFRASAEKGWDSWNPNVEQFLKNAQALRVIISICGNCRAEVDQKPKKKHHQIQVENNGLLQKRKHPRNHKKAKKTA